MADEIFLGNKTYVSSKRAAKECGYAQDYVGQLARSGMIDAQRVGGLWYVSMDSLEAYKRNAEAFVPKPPEAVPAPRDPDTIVSFDGQDYVSAARAAKLTGYNADYIGQLARGGKILSRQVGNRWYVERNGLLAHKTQKDSLLASVQAESVGLVRPVANVTTASSQNNAREHGPYLTYIREDDTLMPVLTKPERYVAEEHIETTEPQPVPIRIVPSIRTKHVQAPAPERSRITVRTSGKTMNRAVKAVAALTVVIVVSYGFTTLRSDSLYAFFRTDSASTEVSMLAGAATAFDAIGDMIEDIIAPEMTYLRK